MPIFEYRIRDLQGKRHTGTLVAENPRQARDKLRSETVVIESLKAVLIVEGLKSDSSEGNVKKKTFANSVRQSLTSAIDKFAARGPSRQVSWFTRELATLLRVGTPLVDAIQITIYQVQGKFKYILIDISEQVSRGSSFGDAIRRHPYIFDLILCEMVSVGEQSGSLFEVLSQVAEFREKKERLKDRVLSAMLYPTLVFAISIVVSIFLMTVVAPTLINSLEGMNRSLPWPTRILKSISDFLLDYGFLIAISIIALLIVAVQFVRSNRGRIICDQWLLALPMLGNLIRKQDCSRLCLVTATLIRSGVELVRALEIGQEAIMNSQIRTAISTARQRVQSGMELGAALRSGAIIPVALIQVFSLGQHTGQLEQLLFQISLDYDHQVQTLADRLTTVLEPVLIIGLSIIVGFILLATLLPILEAGNVVSET